MRGDHVGALNILLRYSYNTGDFIVLRTHNTPTGFNWQRGEIDLSAGNTKRRDFEVVFEGVVGDSFGGDIALDDLSLTPECEATPRGKLPGQPTGPPPTPGACGPNMYSCNNGKCYSPKQMCNFFDDCGDNTDESMCGE